MASTQTMDEQVDPPPPPLKLKVFQASPLAYGNIPIPFMDLDEEEDILKEALQDSNIDVTFEIATAHGLSAFLSQGSSFLHLSCHGHPHQLFIEDGYGGCHILVVGENLQRWIGKSLELVFVSACHSRSAGEAFLDAGVPYVVCCENDGYQLLDQAARIFAREFYTAIAANTMTIPQAYELAKHTVIQSPELRRVAGIDPEVEARKFVLLTQEKCDHDDDTAEDTNTPSKTTSNDRRKELMTSFERHSTLTYSSRRRLMLNNNSSNHSLSASQQHQHSLSHLIPVPPQPFLERELDMYGILKKLFIDRRKVRLIRVTGERGIGKVSLAKAIAQYVKKRNMWGPILWLPPPSDGSFRFLTQEILKNYAQDKALLIIDATKFSDHRISLLCSFLDDVFDRTKYLKVIVIHPHSSSLSDSSTSTTSTRASIESKRHKSGFSCFEESFPLRPLSPEAAAFLFCHSCSHLRNWHRAMSCLLQRMQSDETVVWKVLGHGNPARILLMAKHVSAMEFEKLTKAGDEPLQMDDFRQSFHCVAEKMTITQRRHSNSYPEADATQIDLKSVVIKDLSTKFKPARLRTQEEIIDRFLPILRHERVYRKSVRSFIRKAVKGEHIVTTINGVKATENTVEDDTSWVVCGQVANEFYPLSEEKFKTIYDTDNPEEITAHTNEFFHKNGFKSYRSKRKVWAHEVDEGDMSFFRQGDDDVSETTEEAYFMAPWGKPNRIELGDFLVLKHPDGEDDIYRIERTLFEGSYTDIHEASTEQADDLRAQTIALEERMAFYRNDNPDFAALEGDIRRHLQTLLGALDKAEEEKKSNAWMANWASS